MQSTRPVDRDVQLPAVQRLSGGDQSNCADVAQLRMILPRKSDQPQKEAKGLSSIE
ncbi:hypothetical protein U1Q18_044737 [Sarracenia purpurea var. burkii]